jgi:hypothetical protein
MATIIPPHPLYNRVEIPGNFCKHVQFENFVRSVLFPSPLYTWVSPAGSLLQNIKHAENQVSLSGFIVQDNSTGFEFSVECRYHRSLIANSCSFFEKHKFPGNDTGRPVFLILGLGGLEGSPNAVFLANLRTSSYQHFYKRHLLGKSIATHTPVPSSALWQPGLSHTLLSRQIA